MHCVADGGASVLFVGSTFLVARCCARGCWLPHISDLNTHFRCGFFVISLPILSWTATVLGLPTEEIFGVVQRVIIDRQEFLIGASAFLP